MEPFLKWPGGKRWIAPCIAEMIKEALPKRYIEPFLGGGAVYFALQPKVAILGDINEDLILTYRQVKRDADAIVSVLRDCPVSKRAFYRIRSDEVGSSVERAARFLYLNRTAFGGMYRVNQRGGFNVPFGGGYRTPAQLTESSLLQQASVMLRRARLLVADFERLLDIAGPGDAVYCDPTYTVTHNNNGFIRYNERNFSWYDQIRLARAAGSASCRGAFVLISNAEHPAVRALYPRARIRVLSRVSTVSPNPSKRRVVEELLIAP